MIIVSLLPILIEIFQKFCKKIYCRKRWRIRQKQNGFMESRSEQTMNLIPYTTEQIDLKIIFTFSLNSLLSFEVSGTCLFNFVKLFSCPDP